MGLALDEPQKEDEVFHEEGITYVISKQLLEEVKPIRIDFVETAFGSGYRISSNLQKPKNSCC